MSGALAVPGTVTVEWLDDTASDGVYPVDSGPWVYAEWLCFKPAGSPDITTYVPLANIATWSKVTSNPLGATQ